jgi:hypothetical protein
MELAAGLEDHSAASLRAWFSEFIVKNRGELKKKEWSTKG